MGEITLTRAVRQLGSLCKKSSTLNTFVRLHPEILVEFQQHVDKQPVNKFSHVKSQQAYDWIAELGVGVTITTGQLESKVGYLGGAATAFVRKAVADGVLERLRRGVYKIVSLEAT